MPEYAQQSWEYGAQGRVLAAIDANGNRTDYAYDAIGQLFTITEPADITGGSRAVTTYSYDNAGRVLTVIDPTGNVTTNIYNQVGRLTKTNYSDGSSRTMPQAVCFASKIKKAILAR